MNIEQHIQELHSQFPELDTLQEGPVGSFVKGAATQAAKSLGNTAMNAIKKVPGVGAVATGVQKAVQAGKQQVAKTQPQNPGDLESQFKQQAGGDLEAQFKQQAAPASSGFEGLEGLSVDPEQAVTSIITALNNFISGAAAPAAQAPATQPAAQAPADPSIPKTNRQAESYIAIYKRMLEAEAAPADRLKTIITQFLKKYPDSAAILKDKTAIATLQKIIGAVAANKVSIPGLPETATQDLQNISAGADQQQAGQQAGQPKALANSKDLAAAIKTNPQAADALVGALTRAPKTGPVGQAVQALIQ